MAKKLIVLGAAESGIGAAILAIQKGFDVFVSDSSAIAMAYKQELIEHNIAFEEGKHSEEKILLADIVIKSPGIPDSVSIIQKIKEANIEIISEIEFAFRYKGNSKIVAITGTNGKTTTTSLIYHICKEAGLDCAVVGNIGFSFAKQLAQKTAMVYILEISSFQLDGITSFRPDVAVLMNITEDHLDRYDYRIENYIDSKFKIAKYQTEEDYFIYNLDDERITDKLKTINILSKTIPFTMKKQVTTGAYIQDKQMVLKTKEERVKIDIYEFALKGKHNQYNTMAAGIAAQSLNIRNEKIREAIQTFENLEHRMEFVRNVNGVEFINDSKGTNLNSVWFALESIEQPTVLILGGIDKGNDYSIIAELVKEKVKAIVCMGKDNSKIIEYFEGMVPVYDTHDIKTTVLQSLALATEGDVVLLSPGCASFDLFENYQDRGIKFKEAVAALG